MEPLLKAVFHVHTRWSGDAVMQPKDLVERCLEEGVDVLAVTDHNEIEGAKEVQRRAPFQVIIGEEVLVREGGEIIGLFLRDHIPRGRPTHEVIARIREQGGLVYLPHPFDRSRGKSLRHDLLATLTASIDIVETFNARNQDPAADRAATDFATRHGKVSCAGADAHSGAEIGRTYVELPPFLRPAELLVALQNARRVEVRTPAWTRWASGVARFIRHPHHV